MKKVSPRILPLFQSQKQKACECLGIFSPQVQELMLCKQSFNMNAQPMKESENNTRWIATGLMPVFVTDAKIIRRKPFKPSKVRLMMSDQFCCECALPVLPHITPEQRENLYSLEQAIRQSSLYLYTFQDAMRGLIDEHVPPESVGEAWFYTFQQQSEVKVTAEKEEIPTTRRIRFRTFVYNWGDSPYTGTMKCRKFVHIKPYESLFGTFIKQRLPLSTTADSLLTPLSLSDVSQNLPQEESVMLIKTHVILYCRNKDGKPEFELRLSLVPLTQEEQDLLQKQSRLDGEPPHIVPYGCVLYSENR